MGWSTNEEKTQISSFPFSYSYTNSKAIAWLVTDIITGLTFETSHRYIIYCTEIINWSLASNTCSFWIWVVIWLTTNSFIVSIVWNTIDTSSSCWIEATTRWTSIMTYSFSICPLSISTSTCWNAKSEIKLIVFTNTVQTFSGCLVVISASCAYVIADIINYELSLFTDYFNNTLSSI